MPPYSDMSTRFWGYVDKSRGPKSCWLWTGGLHKFGYGMFNMGRDYGYKTVSAHRLSYILTHNLKLNDYLLYVCHDCPGGDNPTCCNPNHLYLGDAKTNSDDTTRKGRRADTRGEKAGRAILTEEIVRQLRTEYVPRKMSAKKLSEKYSLPYWAVYDAINRRSWGHI